MRFQFYTLGGKQFWEDVFFYQKWRIQRHYKRKIFRLLDNWDICRAEGSFETCRKAFVKYIEVYEIPRQAGELVVMLHGLGETKSMFRPLWRVLTDEGYHVAALNYPSTKKSMKQHLQQLDFFLTHCEDISKVSFITYGSGALLLRRLLAETFEWQNNFKISRIININPNNCGSDLFEILARYKFFNAVFGPMLKDCATSKARFVSKLPADIDLGLIFSKPWYQRIFSFLTKRYEGFDDALYSESAFSNNVVEAEGLYWNVISNPNLIKACRSFLKTGKFR